MLSADACLIVTVVVKTVLSEDYKHVQPYKQFTWCQFCYAVHIHSCVLLESVLCNSWTFGRDNAVHLKKKKKKNLLFKQKRISIILFFHETSWRKKTKQFCWRSTSNDPLNGFYQAHRRVFSTFRVFAPDLQLIILTLGALQLSKQCACWSHCCLIKSIVIWFDICHVTTLSLI